MYQHAQPHIEKLVINNFKSYAGRHEIGPFDKFTSIIGPNGSGKSNIMDAISFCLGIKTKHLRGERLKDLVYRREEETVDANQRGAEVTLVFKSAKGIMRYFSRIINTRGEANYRYGTSTTKMAAIGYEEYSQLLASENIFVRARSFLVFQGDVMQLARRQGSELTAMLETISGSEQLKERYTELSKDLELAQEKARMHFQHRREAETTLTLLEQQRAEVKRFQDLKAQKEALIVEAALFRLYCADRDATKNLEEAQQVREELSKTEHDLRKRRKALEASEVRRQKLETEVREAESDHFALNAALEQRKPEIANCRKQAAHWTIKEREAQARIHQEQEKMKTLEAEWHDATAKREAAEKELADVRRRKVDSALKLTAAQRREYEQAVQKTEQLNTKARDKLREAEEKLRRIEEELKVSKEDLQERQDKRGRLAAKVEDLGREKRDLEISLDTSRIEVQHTKRQIEQLEEEVKNYVDFKDGLSQEKSGLTSEVDSVKARREQLDKLEQRQRVADELRGRFPDLVLGRISELLLPTQKRFDLPLQMALGAMAEAFVVKDAAAARQCLTHLKEGRISSETFLSLDRLDDPKVGDMSSLTQGRAGRRLATLCVQHNDKFLQRQDYWRDTAPAAIDRTVNFLLKGVVIADTLEEAKQTSYVDAKKMSLLPRVVTLEGEVIAPNGNMSVKSLAAGRVEFGGAEQLQEMRNKEKKLQQVTRDLTTLEEDIERKLQKVSELKAEVAQKEAEQAASEPQQQQRAEVLDVQAQELQNLSKNIEEVGARLEQGESAKEKLRSEKESLEAELLKLGRAHFQKLNSELGVEDIREVMLREERQKQKFQSEVEQYEDFLRRNRAEETRAEQRFRSTQRMDELERDLEQYRRDIRFAENRAQDLEGLQRVAAEKVQAALDRHKQAVENKEQSDAECKEAKSDIQQMKAQAEEAKKRLKKQNDKVKMLFSIICTIFFECRERHVELPLLETDGDKTPMERVLTREQDVEDMGLKDLEAAVRSVQVDFSHLPEEKKELAAEDRLIDSKTVEAEYAEQVTELTRELENLNPNMRAMEQCEVEESKLQDIRQQADVASIESQRILREFEAVKADRVSRFMKCFKHIEERINPYYSELTSYDGFAGGSAYLDLDDPEEPYNGGITFTACPPGKRFFPMELLSGGERSMASMALLFAMHSFQPPPFMILDEVDAPFDKKNTSSLVNYLKKMDFQCVVISLKDTFFAHSDSIVGVFKDRSAQTSGILSLPLQRLGKLAEAGGEVPLTDG